MQRIFLTLALIATGLLIVSIVLGLQIDDAASADTEQQSRVSVHFLTSLSALVFATLVHAVVLTYFMGTGRWMEETGNAYSLEDTWFKNCHSIKYRLIIQIGISFLLLLATGAFGAAADPAAARGAATIFGVPSSTVHLFVALLSVMVNLWVFWNEYTGIRSNSRLVNEVLDRVREIRLSRGLSV